MRLFSQCGTHTLSLSRSEWLRIGARHSWLPSRFSQSPSRCPLDSMYGGMPGAGGYSCATEYEIGAQTIAEALHCLLGSLAKAKHGENDFPYIDYEEEHIREELGIINRTLREYARPVYDTQLQDPERRESARRSMDSISQNSPKLFEKAQAALGRLRHGYPISIRAVAVLCYEALMRLAAAMWESVGDKGFVSNAFRDEELRAVVSELNQAVLTLLNDQSLAWRRVERRDEYTILIGSDEDAYETLEEAMTAIREMGVEKVYLMRGSAFFDTKTNGEVILGKGRGGRYRNLDLEDELALQKAFGIE